MTKGGLPASRIIRYLLLSMLLSACNNKPQQPDLYRLILSLKQTGILVTTDYTLTKVIRASDDKTWYKVGDRKILINCEANLTAGINLQSITKNNFDKKNDSSLAIILPHAQLFSLSIPPDKIGVAYQEIGAFRDPFTADEREQLIAQAEPQIKSLVASLGILQTAETNATVFIQNLFETAGFREVTVTFQ